MDFSYVAGDACFRSYTSNGPFAYWTGLEAALSLQKLKVAEPTEPEDNERTQGKGIEWNRVQKIYLNNKKF